MKLLKLNIRTFEDGEGLPIYLYTKYDDSGLKSLGVDIDKIQGSLDKVTSTTLQFKPNIDTSQITNYKNTLEAVNEQAKRTIKDLSEGMNYRGVYVKPEIDKTAVTDVSNVLNKFTTIEPKIDENSLTYIQNTLSNITSPLKQFEFNVDASKLDDYKNRLEEVNNRAKETIKELSNNDSSNYLIKPKVDEASLTDVRNVLNNATTIEPKIDENALTEIQNRLTNILSPSKQFEFNVDTDKLYEYQDLLSSVNEHAKETAKSLYNDLSQGVEKVSSDVPNANDKLKEMENELDKLKSKASGVVSTLKTMLSSLGIQTSFAGIASAMKEGVMNSADYTESLNLFEMSMKNISNEMHDYAEEAENWASKISNALYLDDAEVMKYTGSFVNLTKGLKVSSDAAYLMSTNLTQLTFDMASYLNISNEAAYNKLMSAMSGQTKAVTNVGVAVQSASLEELALSLNIDKSVESMTQAEKTALRYIQIMNSTKQMQGDLARTIITPANAFRMLKTQLTLFARAVGNVLIPIVYSAMPPLIALTRLLTNLAKVLGKKVGIEIPEVDYDSISNISDEVEKIGNSADGTKKKLKNMLAPFDELNVVESQSSSGSGNDTSDVLGILEKYLDGYDMLADLTSQMSDEISKWEKKLESAAKWIPIIVAGFLGYKAFKFAGSVAESFVNISKAGSILSGLGSAGSGTTGLGKLIIAMKGFNIKKWVEELIILEKFSFSGEGTFLTKFASGLDVLKDKLGIFGKISGIIGVITGLATAFKNGGEEASNFSVGLNILATGLSGFFAGGPVVGVLSAAGAAIATAVGAFKKNKDNMNKIFDDFENEFGDVITNFNKSITKLKINPNMIIDNATIEEINTNAASLCDKMITTLNTKKEEQNGILKTMLDRGGITQEEYEQAVAGVDNYNTTMKEKTEAAQKEINEITAKYKDEKQVMSEEDRKRLTELQQQLNTDTINIYTENATKRKVIAEKLSGELGNISKELASETIKDALKTRDETIKAADEQYSKELLAAETMYATGAINKETYDKMVEDAKKTRKDTVDEANKQYDEIYNGFAENNKDIAKYIDKDTGEIKPAWKVLWDDLVTKVTDFGTPALAAVKGIFQKIKDWITNIKWPKFKIDFDANVTGVKKAVVDALGLDGWPKIGFYAEGGFPTTGDLFIANEAGPEFVTSIGNKSAVVNQDQMVQAVSNAIIAGFNKFEGNNNNGNTVIYLGNKKLYDGQSQYQSRQTDRYGTNIINI